MLVMRRNNPDLLDSWFNNFEPLMNEKTSSVNGFQQSSFPAANVTKDENSWNIYLAVPSCNKDDFNIKVEENILTIAKEKVNMNEQESEQQKEIVYTLHEFSLDSFSRSFELPESADVEKITAKYDNGILLIRIEKKQQQESIKSISVN